MKVIAGKNTDVKKILKIMIKTYFSSLKEAKEYIKNKIKNKECFTVYQNKELLGFLTYHRDYSHDANYVGSIVVSKKHRRKGISKLLLKKFIEISKKEQPKKQKYALSSTDATNINSIKMHLSIGFKEIGRIKKLHYGKDEIIFGYVLR